MCYMSEYRASGHSKSNRRSFDAESMLMRLLSYPALALCHLCFTALMIKKLTMEFEGQLPELP